MKNMRMVLSLLILAGLLSLALYAGFIALRSGGSETPVVDLPPEQQTAEAALAQGGQVQPPVDIGPQTIAEPRFLDNTTVILNYRTDLQMVTASEQSAFAQVPRTGTTEVIEAPTPDTSGQAADDGSAPLQDQEVPPATLFPTEIPAGRPEMINLTAYVVANGDNLYQISQRRDTSIALMAQYNLDASDIVVGATIQLPIVNPSYCAGYRDYHLVLEGDNVFRIADKFSITRESIRDANGLDDTYMIKTNNVLCIP